MKTITLVGKPAAGTTTAGRELAGHFGIEYITTSGIFRRHLGEDADRQAMIDLGLSLGRSCPYGVAEFTLKTLDSSQIYVIDRMIMTPDIEYLHRNGSLVVLVTADERIMAERMLERDDAKDGFCGNEEEDRARAIQMIRGDRTEVDVVRRMAHYEVDTSRQHVRDDSGLFCRVEKYIRK